MLRRKAEMNTTLSMNLDRFIESYNGNLYNLQNIISIQFEDNGENPKKITVYTIAEEYHTLYTGCYDICNRLMNQIKLAIIGNDQIISVKHLVERIS